MNSEEPTAADVLVGESRRFRRQLLDWYDRNRRDLPWRQDLDPYRVWLSEIMLQQTRVAAVVEHYHRFLQRFPTIARLAAARESSVLAAWSGLGYYRRARRLHATAKLLVQQHGGKFPRTTERLRELPGIGRYTAAAIASIAFNQAVAVVDGNVERVLERVAGNKLGDVETWQRAQELLSRQRPGDFNQAMMELGATVCVPRQPRCAACPVMKLCATRGELRGSVRAARQKKREIHYALHHRDSSVLLVQRPMHASLMPGMWELPEIKASDGWQIKDAPAWLTLRHSITVTDYVVRVRQGTSPGRADGFWVAKNHLPRLPLTGLARKILRAANLI
jgi:A/G-specific adenine glycosylase